MGQRIACLWRRAIELEGKTIIRVGRKVAEGGFSYVYIATDQGGTTRALKRVRIQSTEQKALAEHELKVHRELSDINNRHILPLLDFGFFTIKGIHELLLLYPLRNTSLRDEINNRVLLEKARPWSTNELLNIFNGICLGLQVLHDHNPSWAHRDLKPENILMTNNGTPQLIDFGSLTAANVAVRTRKEALFLQENAAQYSTISFRAPELFDVPSSIDIDARTDIWSLGCLCYAMIFGYSPFECEFSNNNGIRVVECTYLRVIGRIPEPPESLNFSNVSYQIAMDCLEMDVSKRPFIQELLDRIDTAKRDAKRKSYSSAI